MQRSGRVRELPIIGRDQDLRVVAELFGRGERLVTIVGPPGVGKTRLARAVAAVQPADPPPFCDLTEARTASDLVAAVSSVLGIEPRDVAAASAPGTVARMLDEHDLVVLDNFDDLVVAGSSVLEQWLAESSRVRFLVASRRRIGLASGEVVHELGPLATTDERGDRSASPALRLFLDLASRVRRGLADSPEALADSIALVEALEGFPLAIELAAARMAIMSPRELAARPQPDALSVPLGHARGYTSLEAAIAKSWDALSPAERAVLAQLSVFHGSFTVRAAEAVVDLSELREDGGGTAPPILDIIHVLRDSSLVRIVRDGSELRLGMHRAIRELAALRLDDAMRRSVVDRHARWFASRAPADLHDDLENATMALRHLRAIGERDAAIALIRALFPATLSHGPLGPYLAAIDEMIAEAKSGTPAAADRGLLVLRTTRVETLSVIGAVGEALAESDRAATLAKQLGDVAAHRRVLALSGGARLFSGQEELATVALEAALRTSDGETVPDDVEELARRHLGYVLLQRGETAAAAQALTRAGELARARGDREAEARIVANLGLALQDRGDRSAAREHYQRALASTKGALRRAYYIGYDGTAAHEEGDLETARTRYEEASEILAKIGDRRALGWLAAMNAAVAARHDALELASKTLAEAERIGAESKDVNLIWLARFANLELLASRARAGDAEAHAEALRLRAEATTGAAPPASRSWDVRLMVRLFAGALAPSPGARPSTSNVTVARDGAWFAAGGEPPTQVGKYRASSRLLGALVAARESAPGTAMSVNALFRAGWPGERIQKSSAANRVRVALATLRSLGLRDVILHNGDGYLLEPSVEIAKVSEEGS